MSTLLEQASLVMIPSGYKEDVVYSQIPTNGNGDLSFTRASNGTRINSAGLVEVCPWNLLQQSETFDNAAWVKSNSTITANNTTAPNGTTTAEKLVEDTNTGLHQVYQEIFASGSVVDQYYTLSCYAKASERNKITFILQTPNASQADFDLVNGTASITGGTGTAGVVIESVGDGWFRCSIYRLNTSTGYIYGNIVLNNGSTTSYTGNGTSGAFIWGAQLNIGSTAKPYFPTTDRLNVPRLTYQNGGGGCPSLLLEPQRTNLLIYSEQFEQWSTNGTTTANAGISPDGTQNADRLNYTSGNIYWLDASINVTNGVSYTYSLYVKPTSVGNQFRFYLDGAFNDSTVITTDSSDWKRYTWTFTASATGSINPHVLLGYGYSSQSILVWGAQLEASSYPTSYIPTTSASATRVADACYKTGISSLIGQTEGVLFVDFNFENTPDVNGNIVMIIYGASGEAFIYILGGNLLLQVYNSGVVQGNISISIGAVGRKKIAFAYKQNDFVGYMNGTQIGTDTSGTIPAMSTLRLGEYYATGYSLNSGINEAVLFPTRLTNAELASLTTL